MIAMSRESFFDRLNRLAFNYLSLLEDRGMRNAMGRLTQGDDECFDRELMRIEFAVEELLECVKEEMMEQPACYWLRICRRRLQKLRHTMEDMLMAGGLNAETARRFATQMELEKSRIRAISAMQRKTLRAKRG